MHIHIGIYEGDDKRNELRSAFTGLAEQFSQLSDFSLPYPVDQDDQRIDRKVRFFLIGDTMFLSAFCGHKGPSAKYPCLFCKVPRQHLQMTGCDKSRCLVSCYKTRDLVPDPAFSMTELPLFDISLDNIAPPVLHCPLGIFGDIFKAILDLTKQIDLANHFELSSLQADQYKNVSNLAGLFKVFKFY